MSLPHSSPAVARVTSYPAAYRRALEAGGERHDVGAIEPSSPPVTASLAVSTWHSGGYPSNIRMLRSFDSHHKFFFSHFTTS